MTAFDSHLEDWRAWQESPWGRIRYRVAAHTLARTCGAVAARPLRVLDVGGGDGSDSAPLADAGHDVTVLDRSEVLLAQARSRADLRTVCADLDDLPGLGLGTFDLVLCHNVIQYRPHTVAVVGVLAGVVAVGGAISLMAPNPPAEVLAAVIRRADLQEAAHLVDAPTIRTATFDQDVRRVGADEVVVALQDVGFSSLTRYGIRCVTDYIADDDRKSDPDFYAELEALELTLCDREPFVRTARMWQLVARRP
ncbi:class I SAM-dependent methyltransferase [Cellulomonas sp. P5_C5]